MAGPYYTGNGAGFLTDYSPIAAAGSAFQGFASAFQDAQDKQMKRTEQQAQIEAIKSKTERDKQGERLDLYKAQLMQNPDTGEYQERPLTQREQIGENTKLFGEGGMKDPNDPTGTHIITNTASPKYLAAQNAGLRGQAAMIGIGTRQDNQAASAVHKIHDDKVIVQMRGQATNIDKGLDTLEGSATHKPSWLEVNEVAQDYANALSGAKGSSDFKLKQSEQESFDKYLGDVIGRAKSDPNQPADDTYINFYKQFGQRLKSTYDKQLGSRASNLLTGSKTAYAHNPNAFGAMKEAADLYRSGGWRNDPDVGGGLMQTGMIKPGLVPTGMVNQGMVQGAAPAQTHPEADAAVQWAKANPKDPRAAEILKRLGQ